MNKIQLIGRLGADAELRATTNSQTPVISFSMAVDDGYGENKLTMWVKVSLFGVRATETLRSYLTKGTQVFVDGRLSPEKVTDPATGKITGCPHTYEKDGVTKATWDVVANDIQLLGSPSQNETAGY